MNIYRQDYTQFCWAGLEYNSRQRVQYPKICGRAGKSSTQVGAGWKGTWDSSQEDIETTMIMI